MDRWRLAVLVAGLSLVVGLGGCASSRHRPPPPMGEPAAGTSNLPPGEADQEVLPEPESPEDPGTPPATEAAPR